MASYFCKDAFNAIKGGNKELIEKGRKMGDISKV
jgi:hypothetical protein